MTGILSEFAKVCRGCAQTFSMDRCDSPGAWGKRLYCSRRCKDEFHNARRHGIKIGVAFPGSFLVPLEPVEIMDGEFVSVGWLLKCSRPRADGKPCGGRKILRGELVRSHTHCGCGDALHGEHFADWMEAAGRYGKKESLRPGAYRRNGAWVYLSSGDATIYETVGELLDAVSPAWRERASRRAQQARAA